MNREEAAEALQLIRRVVSQARDDSALQNWGLILQGHREPGPYVFLWGAIIPLNLLSIFWLQRREAAGVRSFIEPAGGPQARLV